MKKRIMSLLLALSMVISLLPSICVAADEEDGNGYYFVYDFSRKSKKDLLNLTREDTLGLWSVNPETEKTAGDLNSQSYGLYIGSKVNEWIAIDINITANGNYIPTLVYNEYKSGGTGSVYILPGGTKNIGEAIDGDSAVKLGTISFNNSGNMTEGHEAVLESVPLDKGEYIIVFRSDAKGTNGTKQAFMFPTSLTFTAGKNAAAGSLMTDKESLDIVETLTEKINITNVYKSDISVAAPEEYNVSYASINDSVAEVSADGTVTAKNKGKTQIIITATFGIGENATSVKYGVDINVFKPEVTSFEFSAEKNAAILSEQIQVFSTLIFNDGLIQKTPENVTYNITGSAEISDGILHAKEAGIVKISATTAYDGKSYTSEEITLIFVNSMTELGYSPYTLEYDFSDSENIDLRSISREQTKGFWEFLGETEGTKINTLATRSYGIYMGTGVNKWVALKIYVPVAGKYKTVLNYSKYRMGGTGSLYILPENVENITNALATAKKLGTTDYNNDSAAMIENFEQKLSDVEFDTAGEYILVFKSEAKGLLGTNQAMMYPRSVTFIGDAGTSLATVLTDKETLTIGTGNKDAVSVTAVYKSDYSLAAPDEYAVSFASADASVASVDEHGAVTGVSEGKTEIIVSAVSADGKTRTEFALPVTVLDLEVTGVTLSAKESVAPYARKIPLSVEVEFNNGVFVRNAEKNELEYNVSGNAVVVDEKVRAESAGEVTISASFTFGGQAYTSNEVIFSFTESTKKTAPSYFTYEKRANAQANAQKYDWAKKKVESAKNSADKYIQNLEILYNGIFGEGIPRSAQVGCENDQQWRYCRYCGENIGDKYAANDGDGYLVDPYSRQWQIQCRDCKRLFPSNDFALLYKRGLDEHGFYDRDRAVEENAKAVARGEKDALKNDLYPEIAETNLDPRGSEITWGGGPELGIVKDPATGKAIDGGRLWGVDDGLGYLPGRTYDDGLVERHSYIAFYGYYFWYQIRYATTTLADAYVYTDDPKYGRAGALLIDRIADVFPSFSFKQWDNDFLVSHGGSGYGKITGRINDCQMTQGWITCADAFFPILSDETLIKTLSEKSVQFNQSNPKTSADLIWESWSDGILRETFEACKSIDIYGNYGMQQWALSSAALVLSSEPESREMVEWIFKTETKEEAEAIAADPNFKTNYGDGRIINRDGTEYCVGGYLGTRLVDGVDRDGHGTEGSPNYNHAWALRLYPVAEMLNMYTDASEYNIYHNSKFIKMFTSGIPLMLTETHTAQIGDSGATAGIGFTDRDETIYAGFENLKDTPAGNPLAEYIYIRNGHSAKGLNYGIFHPEPESMEKDVLSLIDDDLSLASEMLAGFGYAILRDGKKYGDENVTTYTNNMRDFWMYFGGAVTSHAHYDTLNLGIEAFGLNMAPDIGYPEKTGNDPNRMTWVMPSISHNTVTVSEKEGDKQTVLLSKRSVAAQPLHFDDSQEVKLMDIDASDTHEATDIYRRTVVMIKAGPNESYGVDFFRVKGGDEHIYSFHSQSNAVTVEGAELIPDPVAYDENGEPIRGSYAGADVPFGQDPSGSYKPEELKYPVGYTWFTDVRRAENAGSFSVDFKVTDYNKVLKDSTDLHLRMTMLNNDVDELALAGGYVLKKSTTLKLPETLEYVLAKREGNELDSLYTAVYEPYKKQRYLSEMREVTLSVTDGAEKLSENDTAKAIKVVRTDGRIDYIMYATNNNVTYNITDAVGENCISFNFRGFVGVYSVNESGEKIYSYLNDGDILSEAANLSEKYDYKAYSGKVLSFTDSFVDENGETIYQNSIEIETENEIDVSGLINDYVYIDNDGVQNAVYKIETAEATESGVRLGIGLTSVIRGYADKYDTESGFVYNIAKNDKAYIPLAHVEDKKPNIDPVSSTLSTSAGSSITLKINADSLSEDKTLSYYGTTLPRGASVNSSTGVVTWKPDKSQIGEHYFSVTVRDTEGRENDVGFVVTVYGSTTGGTSSNDSIETPSESTGASGDTSASAGGGGGGGNASVTDSPEAGKEDESHLPSEKEPGNSEVNEGGNAASDASDETEAIRFIDLGNHTWAADAINELANDGVVKGTSATTYSPSNNITRADFAILLVRAFEQTSENTENFDDVFSTDYFVNELAISRNTGIVSGIGNNMFAPRKNIMRQDMMLMTYRALKTLGIELEIGENNAPDLDKVDEYAHDAVCALVSNGLVNGKNGYIDPKAYTTRAEVAVLLKRILDFTNKK